MFKADRYNIYITPKDRCMRDLLVNHLGATYSEAKGHCRMLRTLGAMNELWERVPELRECPEFIEEGFKVKREQDEALLRRKNGIPKEYADNDRLRPYQREDVAYLTPMDAAGIFNEPRTGKTPTALELIRCKGTKKNLVVCPASLLYTWEKQIRTWVTGAWTFVVTSKKECPNIVDAFFSGEGVRFLIVSKNMLQQTVDEVFAKRRFDTTIVDEAHFLRNYKTAQSKAVYKIKADQRFALTGTPTVKHACDIYGIMHFLHPKGFTSYWNFAQRYFYIATNFYSGNSEVGYPRPERQKELQELIGMYSTSRKRSEVMPWLPKKIVKTVYCRMDKTQSKYYAEMKRTFYTMCEESGAELDAQTALTQMIRLRQLCIDPRMVGFKTRGCKSEMLLQILKDRKEDEKTEPVIIMSMFTSYLKILQEELQNKGHYRTAMIHGEMTNKQKQNAADAFQAGEVDVLLCNIISAGTGFTLDRGTTVIFTDNAWNPADNEQAEDRVTPTTPDQVHEHEVIRLAVAGSVDEKIFDLLERKQSLTSIINQGAREAIRTLLEV